MDLERLFVFDSLQVLLIFNFFLNVLVPLEQLIVFIFSELQSLIEVAFQLLLEGIHLVLLSLDELGFGGDDLLVSFLHVLFSFFNFEFLTHHLYLMCLSIFLLLSEPFLDSLLVQKL